MLSMNIAYNFVSFAIYKCDWIHFVLHANDCWKNWMKWKVKIKKNEIAIWKFRVSISINASLRVDFARIKSMIANNIKHCIQR